MFKINLKYLMKKNGLTPESLALQLDVSSTKVFEVINENKKPSLDIGLKVSDYFSISLQRMYERDLEADDRLDKGSRRLLNAIDQLKSEDRDKLLDDANKMSQYRPNIDKEDDRYQLALEIAREYIESLEK